MPSKELEWNKWNVNLQVWRAWFKRLWLPAQVSVGLRLLLFPERRKVMYWIAPTAPKMVINWKVHFKKQFPWQRWALFKWKSQTARPETNGLVVMTDLLTVRNAEPKTPRLGIKSAKGDYLIIWLLNFNVNSKNCYAVANIFLYPYCVKAT